jgi:hypothetical protein
MEGDGSADFDTVRVSASAQLEARVNPLKVVDRDVWLTKCLVKEVQEGSSVEWLL